MEAATWFICGMFAFAGILSLCAAAFNWDWFFSSANAQMLTGRFSRRTARIVYAVLGSLILLMAATILMY